MEPSQLFIDEVGNELQTVKCVVVGDTGVGKTRLVCSRACDTKYSLPQLVQTHVPTVWAIDQYRKNPQVLGRSWCDIDSVSVSLRLWDTFGDHDKDRQFAYDRADVILVCFSVTQPRSLRNVRSHWYPEIHRLCPGIPIVVCGCQIDLRYLYKDPSFVKLDKGPFYREITDKDVIYPEAGRAVAKHIGALYYETSVLEQFGIDALFMNVSRAALTSKRDRHFWQALGTLKKINRPFVQEPHLCPRPAQPVAKPVTSGTPDLDYSDLLGEDFHGFGDVVFVVRGVEIISHKLCLTVSSAIFEELFCDEKYFDSNRHGQEDENGAVVGITNIAMSVESIDAQCGARDSPEVCPDSSMNRLDCTTLISSEPGTSTNTLTKRDIFKSITTRSCSENHIRMYVIVGENVSPSVWRTFLMYCYSGRCPTSSVDCQVLEETRLLADVLEMNDLALSITNVLNAEEFLNKEIEDRFQETRLQRLNDLILRRGLFSDVMFQLDDGAVNAHRILLVTRCDVMASMFTGNFAERSSKVVGFPGISRDVFLAMLEFLYLGRCPDLHNVSCVDVIELANRLCQPQFVALIENTVLNDLSAAVQNGQDLTDDVLGLLEASQLHNANQLADWCLWYLIVNYRSVYKSHSKVLHTLRPENQIYITNHRWPPVWYLREVDIYEKSSLELQREKTVRAYLKNKNKMKNSGGTSSVNPGSGCFCFCSNVRKKNRMLRDSSSSVVKITA